MRTMPILNWILRIAGTCALVLGLLIWTLQLDIINIHMLFGLSVAILLLVISVMALFRSGLRLLGGIGVIYAFILPVFGMNQMLLLIGNLHWLIQIAHMLVGIGAIALGGFIALRYGRPGQKQSPAL